jgi:DNA mismatch repair ATPase MutS
MAYKPKYKIHQEENPNTVNLQLIGKFYEAFEGDAYVLSNVMGYIVKENEKGTPKCGFPVEALEKVLGKLEANKVPYAVYHSDDIKYKKSFVLGKYKKFKGDSK